MMWRRWSALAALALVLLPIGDTSLVARANVASAGSHSLGTVPGWIPEQAALALLCLNITWLMIRCRRLPWAD